MKVDVPIRRQTISVQQWKYGAETEIASQQLYAPRENIRAGFVQQHEGEFIIRRKAAQHLDFRKCNAHVQNMRVS